MGAQPGSLVSRHQRVSCTSPLTTARDRNLLAFLVLTSGLDNMILVLRAISDTDVNLPVPRRMSKGLRTVGAEMTMLLVVEELLALGLLWWVEITVSLPPETCALVWDLP